MAIIDLSNYDTTLFQASTVAGLDGNVFFDTTAGTIQFFTATTNATLDLTTFGGGATDPNPLLLIDGLKFEAIYAFENQERASSLRSGETLRAFNRWTSGTFKFGGAYNFVNGRTPLVDADRALIRGSGWNEFDASGVSQKIWFGNKGLSNIESGSLPYYQLGAFTTAVPYAKAGQIDEGVLVGGALATDNTANPEIVSVRTYGNNYDRKSTVADLGITELGGYSTGFAVNESAHLTTDAVTDHLFTNVWGVDADSAQTSSGAWLNMTLEKIAVPIPIDEFAEAAGTFTWEINNADSSSLDECVAFLDALATVTVDVDSGAETVTIGKDVDTWYYYNAAGQVVTKSGADALGLYIENVPVADQQRVIFTNDAATTNSYLFLVGVEANVGATAKADILAWYHSYGAAAYDTASAIEVQDSTATVVSGLASAADVSNLIKFNFDYDGDTVLGTAGTNKPCVFLCEGDGGATQAKTLYTLTRSTTIAFTCAPPVENNV